MFKIFRKNCCGLDVHNAWIYACIGITDSNGFTEYKQAAFLPYPKDSGSCLTGLLNTPVLRSVWNPRVSIGFPHSTSSKNPVSLPLPIPNIPNRKDVKWICDLFMCNMIKPSFIPSSEIRQLRNLIRYRFKLTNMLTGEKNRAQNCLTVSNLKLGDVFSDVFGKSARSITNYILDHPSETFDITPFVDRRCKNQVEEIQSAVDGAVSPQTPPMSRTHRRV